MGTGEGSNSVWVVVPTFNDRRMLPRVVREVQTLGYNMVIVDDGSTPPIKRNDLREIAISSSVLSHPKLFLCRHQINLGQGAALQTGIHFALKRGAEFLVTFDADGQHQTTDIPSLLAPLQRGEYEVALGSRFLPGGAAENIPATRRLLLKCALIFTNTMTGLSLTDTHNGIRALSRTAAQRLSLRQNRMAHATELLQQIAEQKQKLIEIPVTIRYTEYSLARGQRISNAFNILWDSFASLIRGG